MPMTAGDMVRKVMSRIPGLQELEAMTLYTDAMQDLYKKHKWSFLLINALIVTEASYNTGTLTATNGSPTVVLDAGSGGTFDTTWTDRRIIVQGGYQIYEFVVVNPTTGTLQINGQNVNWPLASGSGLSYNTYRDQFPMPAQIDWGRDYMWWSNAIADELFMIDWYEMHRLKGAQPGMMGDPEAIARAPLRQASLTTVPVSYVEFGPLCPNQVQAYNFWGFSKPTANASDTQYPLWPEDYEDLIWRRMEILYADSPSHRIALAPTLRQEYRDHLWDCMKRNNGGAEILRVKQTYRGTRRRLPFANAQVFPSITGGWQS